MPADGSEVTRLSRLLPTFLLIGYLLVLGFIVLAPTPDVPSASVSLLRRLGGLLGVSADMMTRARTEFVSNVLIFVPLPMLAAGLRPSWGWRDWTATGFVASSSIELAQAFLLPARSATFSDVVANSLGAACGALTLLLLVRARSQRAGPQDRPQTPGER